MLSSLAVKLALEVLRRRDVPPAVVSKQLFGICSDGGRSVNLWPKRNDMSKSDDIAACNPWCGNGGPHGPHCSTVGGMFTGLGAWGGAAAMQAVQPTTCLVNSDPTVIPTQRPGGMFTVLIH